MEPDWPGLFVLQKERVEDAFEESRSAFQFQFASKRIWPSSYTTRVNLSRMKSSR
jgi:hypothetical protein